jgi:hypothetical protein
VSFAWALAAASVLARAREASSVFFIMFSKGQRKVGPMQTKTHDEKKRLTPLQTLTQAHSGVDICFDGSYIHPKG